MIPESWRPVLAEWSVYIVAALAITTGLVHVLRPIARAVQRWTLTTAVTWDDGPARWLADRLDWLAGALDVVLGLVPHVTVAPTPKPTAKPKPKAPPSDGALALALCVIAAVGSVLSGCSPTELQVHVQVAGGFEDSARETARVVRAYRTEHQRAAALAVHDAGGTEADAIAAMHAAGAELTPLVEAQREYALAVHGYTDALYLAEHTSSGGGLDLASAIPALRDVLDAYRQLRALGAALHVDALAALPAVPQWIDGVLPPQLLASSSPGASSAPQTSGGVQ